MIVCHNLKGGMANALKKNAALKQNGILISMSNWAQEKPLEEDFQPETRTFDLSKKYKIYNYID